MGSVRLLCLAVFAILSTTLAKNLIQPRIISGHDAQEGQFPHMASLRYRMMPVHACGATIISSRFLLTGAHCCISPNPKDMFAVVGAIRQSRGGVIVELDRVTPHKGFSKMEGKFDVAVLRTAKDIIFTEFIQPVALPKEDFPDVEGIQVVLSGWGITKVNNVHVFLFYELNLLHNIILMQFPQSETLDILQYSELETITRAECVKRFDDFPDLQEMLHEANICTVDKKKGGACHGDSGTFEVIEYVVQEKNI